MIRIYRNKSYLYLFLWIVALCLCTSCASKRLIKQEKMLCPKREFRGAWIQTVFQDEYSVMSSASFRYTMMERLDKLCEAGINAIVFQVRPEADAFYKSKYEPWSRFLTGTQGTPPDEPDFDPMAYLIDACHQRNMEFHAWLNPYRVGAGGFRDFDGSHVYHQHPEWFVEYNNQILFDPGIPECRQFICLVVKDIVSRYDVDGIHMDDYFYPYPVEGKKFPDEQSFNRYGQDYKPDRRDDWRRKNVNQLIYDVKHTILETKPWVRFGISPFGIYRNKSSYKKGSLTNGLQNYDDLYADVLFWMKEGWIDYCAPQLYWETGHPRADYTTLVHWWNKQKSDIHLYIGQDVARTMKFNQLNEKMRLARALKRIQGNIFWPANELLWNNGGVTDSLKVIYHRYPALIPAYTHLYKRPPGKIKRLQSQQSSWGLQLQWESPSPRKQGGVAYYVVYRFLKGEKKDLDRSSAIYAITHEPFCAVPNDKPCTYVVTAMDRFHNESKKGRKIKVKLKKAGK